MSDELIQSGDELREYFFQIRNIKWKMSQGVMVNGKIRKEILTSVKQGKIILDGRVKKISFKNMSGGVYMAYIEDNPCVQSD